MEEIFICRVTKLAEMPDGKCQLRTCLGDAVFESKQEAERYVNACRPKYCRGVSKTKKYVYAQNGKYTVIPRAIVTKRNVLDNKFAQERQTLDDSIRFLENMCKIHSVGDFITQRFIDELSNMKYDEKLELEHEGNYIDDVHVCFDRAFKEAHRYLDEEKFDNKIKEWTHELINEFTPATVTILD